MKTALDAFLVGAILLIGFGAGYVGYTISPPLVATTGHTSTQSSVNGTSTSAGNATAASSGPYRLTLVITSNDQWNSNTTAPRFWVMTPAGLTSAATISLPAHRLIELTMVDYDTATPLVNASVMYANVTGTVGGTMMMMNMTATSQNPTNATNVSVVTSVDPSLVGHTFTIPQLKINIPSVANTMEMAVFTIDQPGTYVWHCEDPCGFGSSGWEGPMADAWMGGTINVT